MKPIFPLLFPTLFVAMLVVERLFPAKELPKVRFWLLKGIVFFVLTATLNASLPGFVARALGGRSLLHLRSLGTVPGGLVGMLVTSFIAYWLHRALHRNERLWWIHQMHHSAERMDLAGLSFSHPLNIVLAISLPSIATQLLGCSADAGMLAGFLGFALVVFQHMNVRTPRLLGWLVARPECHGLHHERGIHAYNYGSVPLWDIAFGTFRNPATFPETYGYWDGASSLFGPMLIGYDVSDHAPECR